MALPIHKQAQYWGVAAAVFLGLLWLLNDIILPFVLGGAIAYCLDPIADRLQRLGLSRIASTVFITAFAVLLFVLLALLVIPLLIDQATALANTAPRLAQSTAAALSERFPELVDADSTVRQSIGSLGDTIRERGIALLEGVIASVASIVNVLVIAIVTPVVAFYLLLDWDNMVARVNGLLPLDYAPIIRRLAGEIDEVLASFIRGQGTVCLILGIFYAVALMAVGLQFGLVVGVIAGALTFIPYVGALVGGVLSIGLALFQFWGDWFWIVAVWAIFQFGQFVEGNILTPKLVGDSVGLHPVWLLFALSAFGTLFGFVGLLVAVPVAAMLGVIVRWIISEYLASRLYRGLAGRDSDET